MLTHFTVRGWLPGLILSLFLPTLLQAQDNYVRVRLLRDAAPSTVVLSSTRSMQLYAGSLTNPILELAPNQRVTLATNNDRVYLRAIDEGIFARSLIISQPEDAELTIEVADGASTPTPRTYRGLFLMQVDTSTPSSLQILNDVPLEHYVASVLSSEFDFPELEAAKALALCIRTMSLRNLTTQNGPIYAVPDDESWQVYKGTGSITRTALDAALQTQGQVLLYENELIESVYFSSSGGSTANNEDVWDASVALPYLRGRQDPYDYNSPHHTWESTLSRSDLHSYLSGLHDFQVTGISVENRSRDGRAKNILLRGADNRQKSVPGNEFRRSITARFGRNALKSTLFELNTQPNLYIFIGKGFGHGVGLNQWGALELSQRGQLHNEILDYYYPGVEIGVFQPALAENEPYLASESTSAGGVSSNIAMPILRYDAFQNTASQTASSSPIATPTGSPTSTQTAQQAQTESTSSFSATSRLFGFDEESMGDVSEPSVTENTSSDGSQSQGNRNKKPRRQLPPDAKVVGWTTTVTPVASETSSTTSRVKADSAKTKKRRGW